MGLPAIPSMTYDMTSRFGTFVRGLWALSKSRLLSMYILWLNRQG